MRGATHCRTSPIAPRNVSTHAPLAGSDGRAVCWVVYGKSFQPTLPLRGATVEGQGVSAKAVFQPTLPLRGATLCSAHAYHRECVSTHAPLAGSDLSYSFAAFSKGVFQPTLPLRGATVPMLLVGILLWRFNPRSPCGERRKPECFTVAADGFQPTLPLRGATRSRCRCHARWQVSTHAPLAGSDRLQVRFCVRSIPVSTHAPLAGSDVLAGERALRARDVSTHAPLAGSDSACSMTGCGAASFNPRSPCGERREITDFVRSVSKFQPTLPLRGATQHRWKPRRAQRRFNPRSPCGERPVSVPDCHA